MKIAAVIVTYNRLSLLKECLSAVKRQSMPVSSLVVIDNASTDGTVDFLQSIQEPLLTVKFFEKNIGGAGGFAEGMAIATRQGADAVWIMDDDTIPDVDALKNLVEAFEAHEHVGFVCSKVLWTDGSAHIMNVPRFVSQDDLGGGIYSVRSASFVSLLVPCEIIRKVGLPYREFFIWVDDAEFTSRIFKAGYKGFLVSDSIALHKTATNYCASIKYATPESAWKFYYYMRNSMFAARHDSPWLVWFFKHLNHLRLDMRQTKAFPKEVRKTFRKNLWRGFVDGLSFKPSIEKVE